VSQRTRPAKAITPQLNSLFGGTPESAREAKAFPKLIFSVYSGWEGW